ncbi:MAG: MBL fold metallo-hydrolase [Halobacteriales archaeon]|nr:MBL fold metallo-hydrolase [Halobacteriales archaeon]
MAATYAGLTFERLGHASVRIETDEGYVVYIDPWSEVMDGEPGDADLVIVTHDDFDHYDPTGIDAVTTAGTTVVAYDGIDTAELSEPVQAIGMREGMTVDGIEIETLPAYNKPDGPHVDDDGAPFHAEGEVIGVLLTIDETTVYFTSDTDFLEAELADVTADVFIPPIGGHYTMDRHEAAAFAEQLEPSLVLPVHYDTFAAIETDAEAFKADLEDDGIDVKLF